MAKKVLNQNKPWRVNITVNYYGLINANRYRKDILDLLKHLASIYKLDYAISIKHQFTYDNDLNEEFIEKNTTDLFYIRSNDSSRISKKKFRSVIDSIFGTPYSPYLMGVEVLFQLYKVLNEYSFPINFYRPLNYPYIEIHEGLEKKIYIYTEEVINVIANKDDEYLK